MEFQTFAFLLSATVISASQNAPVAYIQTNEGLHETKTLEKRSLSTDFKSDSTYLAPNGLTCYVCQPGFYKGSDCVRNMTSAVCEKCPPGHYSSTYNIAHYCAICMLHCTDKNAHVFQNCTPTTDTVCRCKVGYYNHSKGPGEWICLPHEPCPPGTEVLRPGNYENNTECRKCPIGSFSSKKSAGKCIKCSICSSDRRIHTQCSFIQDTICESKVEHLGLKIGLPITAVLLIMIGIVVIILLRTGRLVKLKSWLYPTTEIVDRNANFTSPKIIVKGNVQDNTYHDVDTEDEMPSNLGWLEVFRTVASTIKVEEFKPFFRTLLSKKKDVAAAERQIDAVCYDHKHDTVNEKIFQLFIAWQKLCYEMYLDDITESLEEHNMLNLSVMLKRTFPTLMKKKAQHGVEDVLYLRNQ